MREQALNNKRKLITPALLAAMIMLFGSCGQQVDKLEGRVVEASSVSSAVSSDSSSAESGKADDSSNADSKTDKTETDSKADKAEKKSSAEKIFEGMTLDEKIGQLFIVNPEQIDGYDETVTTYDDTMDKILAKYPVGGIIQMTANVVDPEQITALNKKLNKISKYPLFIAVDEEGGEVARIGQNENFDVTRYTSMYDIGDTGDTDQAKQVGVTVGSYLKTYGFNTDFAPDADVYTNPDNTVIGTRAFSSDPQTAADMVSACIDGFHKNGIITAIKHFPGHGDTTGDTHEGAVTNDKSWEELMECELIPFMQNLDNTDMVMVSHITLTSVTDDGLPASISKQVITDKLRNELGYEGVIITDSLSMKAVSDDNSPAQAAVKAVDAGADLLLMPGNLKEAFNGIKKAVKNGDISEERLNESVMRILNLKEKYGLI